MRRSALSIVVITAALAFPRVASAQGNEGKSAPELVAAPSDAVELKVSTGYTHGVGMVAPNRSLPSMAGGGLGFGLALDYRLTPAWSVGGEAQYQQLASRENTSARGLAMDLGATYHFAPNHRDDAWIRLGTGYRFMWENQPSGTSDGVERHGFDLAALKVGYELRASEDVGIAPVLGADLNMFLWESPSNGPARPLSSAAFGTFVFIGLEGRFDFGGTRAGGGLPHVEAQEEQTTSADVAPAP